MPLDPDELEELSKLIESGGAVAVGESSGLLPKPVVWVLELSWWPNADSDAGGIEYDGDAEMVLDGK